MRKTTMVAIAIAMWTVLLVIVGLPLWRHVSTEIRFYKADFFVRDVAVYCKRHGELPLNIQSFCLESARERATQSISEYAQNYQQYVENHFVIKRITKRQLLEGEDFFKLGMQLIQPNTMACASVFRHGTYILREVESCAYPVFLKFFLSQMIFPICSIAAFGT